MIKHVGFDFWYTLFKGKGGFKKYCAGLIHKQIAIDIPSVITDEADIYKGLLMSEKYFNDRDAVRGECSVATDRLMLALTLANVDIKKLSYLQTVLMVKSIEDAFLKSFQPVFFDSNTYHSLLEIKGLVQSVSIISNTGMVGGEPLMRFLRDEDYKSWFKCILFSDIFGVPKPNKRIFEKWKSVVDPDNECSPEELLFIGDNHYTDGGSMKIGVKFAIINGESGNDITSALNYVKNINQPHGNKNNSSSPNNGARDVYI